MALSFWGGGWRWHSAPHTLVKYNCHIQKLKFSPLNLIEKAYSSLGLGNGRKQNFYVTFSAISSSQNYQSIGVLLNMKRGMTFLKILMEVSLSPSGKIQKFCFYQNAINLSCTLSAFAFWACYQLVCGYIRASSSTSTFPSCLNPQTGP